MLCTRMFIVNMKLNTKPPILPHKYYICNRFVLNITHHMLLQMTCFILGRAGNDIMIGGPDHSADSVHVIVTVFIGKELHV